MCPSILQTKHKIAFYYVTGIVQVLYVLFKLKTFVFNIKTSR